MPQQRTIPLTCQQCGAAFLATKERSKRNARFCSHACAHASLRRRIERTCPQCGARFETYEAWIRRGGGVYCSSSCAARSKTGARNGSYRGGKQERVCAQCNRTFLVSPNDETRRFCSRTCSDKGRIRRGDALVDRTCKQCGKAFGVKPSWVARGGGRYCSSACRSLAMRKPDEGVCEHCGGPLNAPAYLKRRFCSVECRSKHLVGSAHPSYKGAIYPGRKGELNKSEYRAWRTAVFERDDYTCVQCGQRGGKLNAHHIEHWSVAPERRFDMDNGATLCVGCHRTVHRKRRTN